MKKKKTKKDLGKGIRALLEGMSDTPFEPVVDPIKELEEEVVEKEEVAKPITTQVNNTNKVHVDKIRPNPFQPRKEFDPEKLRELSNSIKIHGVVQPIAVRKLDENTFQIISGERRWRASKMAELEEIPVYVRKATDQEMLEIALIENIQREDLNAIEISLTYQRLLEECSLTHEVLADRLGKQRSTITNYLRLLKLPPEIQMGVKQNKISMGHARAMLATDDIAIQLVVYKEAVEKGLSVRKVEDLMKMLLRSYNKEKQAPKSTPKLAYAYQKVQDDLSSAFESKVTLKLKSDGKGEIVIPFLSDDDLNRILQIID